MQRIRIFFLFLFLRFPFCSGNGSSSWLQRMPQLCI